MGVIIIAIILTCLMYTLKDVECCNMYNPFHFSVSYVLETCSRRAEKYVEVSCPPKHFYVQGLSICHPWLNCSDLYHISLKELVGVGAVKAVYRAEWKNISIAYSVLNNNLYVQDFNFGLNMLKLLNPNPFIVQLIGYCEEENVILTEYHKFGSALNILDIVSRNQKDDLLGRLRLCLNYANILKFLHSSPAGIRVFCDSNDLEKLLSQLLITNSLTLVLNDVDALPEVNRDNNFNIICGNAPLHGTFVAPEQLWTSKQPYNHSAMLGYDEKTDIWKSAAVCNYFLGETVKTNIFVQYYLFSLHKSCTNKFSQKRPTAAKLVEEYSKIIEMLIS